MEPVPADVNAFTGVLKQGERLLWVGPMKPTSRGSLALVSIVIALGLASLGKDIALQNGRSLPFCLRAEAIAALGVSAMALPLTMWYQFRQARTTMYAVTNLRLLVAIGLSPNHIRASALSELGKMPIAPARRSADKVLHLLQRDSGMPPTWAFVHNGKIDASFAMPYWSVNNPESVRQIIESARADGTRSSFVCD
jgi:hypothetical protein